MFGSIPTDLDPRQSREWDFISQETNPIIQQRQLWVFAQRLASQDRLDAAEAILSHLESLGGEVGEAAKLERGAQWGQSALGHRVEFHFKQFARQALDPGMIVGMMLGSAVFHSVRLVCWTRLAVAARPSLFSRGLAPRVLASSAGMGAEIPSLLLTSKLLHQGMGRPQDWRASTLGEEAASLSVQLFLLKSFAGAAHRLFPGSRIFPSVAMLGGIHAGQYVDNVRTAGGHAGPPLLDSLVFFSQFQIGGFLAKSLFPFRAPLQTSSRGQSIGPFDWEYLKKILPSESWKPWAETEAAKRINGTLYTGFVHDLELAKRFVRLYRELPSLLEQPFLLRRGTGFRRIAANLLPPEGNWGGAQILQLLNFYPTELSRAASKAIRRGKLDLEVVDRDAMRRLWNSPLPLPAAFLAAPSERLPTDPRRVPLIALLEWRSSGLTRETMLQRAADWPAMVVHEYAHFGRDYRRGRPIVWRSEGEQLVGEMLALLEEQSFLLHQGDVRMWRRAAQHPEGPGVFLRNLVEAHYLEPWRNHPLKH